MVLKKSFVLAGWMVLKMSFVLAWRLLWKGLGLKINRNKNWCFSTVQIYLIILSNLNFTANK